MSALTEAMRKRFKTPKEAIRALGLDESLLACDAADGFNESDHPRSPDGKFGSGGGGGGSGKGLTDASDPDYPLPSTSTGSTTFDLPNGNEVRVKRQSDGSYYGDTGDFDFETPDAASMRAKLKKMRAVHAGASGKDGALDSKEKLMPTQFASTAALLVGTAIKPLLKPKAKIDLMPVFKDLTADGFDAKEFQGALDEALKGKLVKGADLKLAFDNFMPHVEGMAKGVDESVSEPQHNAMEAAAHGNSTLGIPQSVGKEFAEADKGKPMPPAKDNLFMKKAMDYFTAKGMDGAEFMQHMGSGAQDAEEEEPEEVTEGNRTVEQEAEDRRARDARMGRDKRADDRRADDRRADDRRADDGDAHHAMDEASIEKRVTEKLKSKFDEARHVKPWVGEVDPMAFDSGEAILRHALKARGHKRWNTAHAEALRDLLDTYPKQGMRPVERSADPKYAMDESRRADAVKLAPGLANIRIGV